METHPPVTFADLGLAPALREAASDLGFTHLTPIQAAALPGLLAGRDLIGQAPTGSGKTIAFALPVITRVTLAERRVQALILCPTRELAVQVVAELRAIGRRSAGLRVIALIGGEPAALQSAQLAEGAHVVVGTPGRTLDLLQRGRLDLSRVSTLVLDEADRMLEMGFADDVQSIVARAPRDRQSILFSATFPANLAELSAGWLKKPLHVQMKGGQPDVEAHIALVDEADKDTAVDAVLRALAPTSALVFRNLKRTVAETAVFLANAGHAAAALHGDLEQRDREAVFARFRNGAIRVLVATDVAARGLDVSGLDLVINADLPLQPEDYTHRIGRTGRAGEKGVAWSLATPGQRPRLGSLAKDDTVSALPAPQPDAGPLTSALTTFWLGAGRRDKLRPGDILGALTGTIGLTAGDVGRIEIQERWSFIAVAKTCARQVDLGLRKHKVKGMRINFGELD